MWHAWNGVQQTPSGVKNVGGGYQQVGGMLPPGGHQANISPGMGGAWQRAASGGPAVVAPVGQRPWAQPQVYHEQEVQQEADHEPSPSHGRAQLQHERRSGERERSKAPASSKMQPQLQHLPRFQPPCFEDYNGNLPCPDSPGSTPREDEEQAQADSSVRSEPPARREQAPGEGRSRTKRSAESYAVREADNGRGSEASNAVPGTMASLDRPAIFAPGSFVEYKSRSSGAWILAKVEDWNESSQTYRLDVQPHAHVDRVRPRRHREHTREPAAEHGRDRDSGHDRHEATPFQNGYRHHRVAENVSQPPMSTLADLRAAEEDHCANSVLRELRDAEHIQEQAVNAYTGRLFTEIETLKQQVMQLQSENEVLQERVKHEAAQKDCYFSELCACHEQLNRARGTPR